nr:histidine-type phosphatase [Escherichia coli]
MKKLILAAAVAGAVLVSSAAQAQTTPEGYQLQQVLMKSRHNLRAPLANNGSVLEQSTPNQWPEWDVRGGQLTTKGGVLEIYMGHYMREWLAELGMVTSGEWPTPDTVYTYANSLQRTDATAQFFITGAFPGCDIPVHHQEKNGHDGPNVLSGDHRRLCGVLPESGAGDGKRAQPDAARRQLSAAGADDGLQRFTVLQRKTAVFADRSQRRL